MPNARTKIVAYHILIKSRARDGYVNMKNMSKNISTVWPIVILRTLEVTTHRIATKYALLLFVQTFAMLLLNSLYERKVCISALHELQYRSVDEIQLNTLIPSVLHICDDSQIITLSMDSNTRSILSVSRIWSV